MFQQSIKKLIYFLLPLTLMISCSDVSDTSTELDEEEEQEQQADQNQNSDQEDGSTANEPVTQTVTGTITQQDDSGTDPGATVPFYYDIFEIEVLADQVMNLSYEASCDLDKSISEELEVCGITISIYEPENFDETDILGGIAMGGIVFHSDSGVQDFEEVVFPADGTYWIVVMGYYQYGESFDKIDYTLSWTIEEYIEEPIPEGAQTETGTLTSDDSFSYCYITKSNIYDVYYDIYTIDASADVTIDFYLEASRSDGTEISDMALALYDPAEFNPDELYRCADFTNLSYHHNLLGSDNIDDTELDYSVEVSVGSYWIVVESPIDSGENFEDIDYTLSWVITSGW